MHSFVAGTSLNFVGTKRLTYASEVKQFANNNSPVLFPPASVRE